MEGLGRIFHHRKNYMANLEPIPTLQFLIFYFLVVDFGAIAAAQIGYPIFVILKFNDTVMPRAGNIIQLDVIIGGTSNNIFFLPQRINSYSIP